MLIVTETEGRRHFLQGWRGKNRGHQRSPETHGGAAVICGNKDVSALKGFQCCCRRATELIHQHQHQHQQSFAFTLKTLNHHQISCSEPPGKKTLCISGSNSKLILGSKMVNCKSKSSQLLASCGGSQACHLLVGGSVCSCSRETQQKLWWSGFKFRGHQHCQHKSLSGD